MFLVNFQKNLVPASRSDIGPNVEEQIVLPSCPSETVQVLVGIFPTHCGACLSNWDGAKALSGVSKIVISADTRPMVSAPRIYQELIVL